MSLDPVTLLAIVAMAVVTYALRVSGLVLADRLAVGGRVRAALDAIPPAVLTAVIAPTLLATGPAETIAGVITIIAATRAALLPTILIGVAAIVVARAVLG